MQSENVVDLREAISHRPEPAPREIGSDDWRRYEEYMQEIFTALLLAQQPHLFTRIQKLQQINLRI